MNIVFLLLIFLSIIGFLFNDFNLFGITIINSLDNSIKLIIDIGLVIILWNGLFNILIDSGFVKKIKPLFKKLILFLYPTIKFDSVEMDLLTTNYLLNLLGLGFGGTASALQVINRLKEDDNNKKIIEDFIILNIGAFSILPISIISYRIQSNSVVNFKFLICCFLLSLLVHVSGIFIVKVFK